MLDEVKEILAERMLIHPENYLEIEKCWNLLIDILSKDEDQTIEVINQLDEKEILYLGAVFEDISEQLQSSRFIECIEQLAIKYLILEKNVLWAKEMLE